MLKRVHETLNQRRVQNPVRAQREPGNGRDCLNQNSKKEFEIAFERSKRPRIRTQLNKQSRKNPFERENALKHVLNPSRRSSPLAISLAVALFVTLTAAPAKANDRDALFADISRLQAEIAELRELRAHQIELRKAMSVDPASALRARRSFESCKASALARYCPFLRGMFQPQKEDK